MHMKHTTLAVLETEKLLKDLISVCSWLESWKTVLFHSSLRKQCIFPQPRTSWYIVKEVVYKVFEILLLKAQTLWCETLKGFLHDLFCMIRYFWRTSDLFLKSDLLAMKFFSFFKMLVAFKQLFNLMCSYHSFLHDGYIKCYYGK